MVQLPILPHVRCVDLQYLQSPFLIGQACSQVGGRGGGGGGGREREGEKGGGGGSRITKMREGGRQDDAHLKGMWQYWVLVIRNVILKQWRNRDTYMYIV